MLLSIARAGCFVAALFALAGHGWGQSVEEPDGPDMEFGVPGTGSWSVRLGLYDRDDNGDGNPFLDESLTVIEPVVIYDRNVSDTFGYAIEFAYDYVSSASIDRLNKFDAQSGASGDFFVGLKSSFRHLLENGAQAGWHVSASKEYDYMSVGLGGTYQHDVAGTDATLKYGLSGYFDQVDIIRFDGASEGQDDRTTFTGSTTWTQILDAKTRGEFGLVVSAQSGFLETPYNAVVVEDSFLPPNPNLDNFARGTEITEELPDSRFRTAVFGRVRRLLQPGTSAELGARIYNDDWGITGLSLEPQLHRMIGESTLWSLRYRYYTQSEADAFQDSFTTVEEERTQDSDLGEFSSHTLGTRFRFGVGSDSQWDVGVDYVSRDNGLDHYYMSVGWNWGF